jgi:hypothetical protein
MSETESVSQERDRIVKAYWDSIGRSSAAGFRMLTSAQRKREYAKEDRLLDAYGRCLPAVPISRCPFCGTVLEYVFDAMGLDGPWWHIRKLAEFRLPKEEHFRVLVGGIDFHGREPAEARVHRTVRPGPGAPYVVARLFELPGMRAVVSAVALPHGDTAYLTAYFSPEPIHGALLCQPWGSVDYEVRDAHGEGQGWGVANDVWDFDLKPWLKSGQLAWINPGDPALAIQTEGPCPFVDLPGTRAPQSIDRGSLSVLDLPTGEPPQPFE